MTRVCPMLQPCPCPSTPPQLPALPRTPPPPPAPKTPLPKTPKSRNPTPKAPPTDPKTPNPKTPNPTPSNPPRPQDAMLFSLEGGLAVGEVPIKAQPQNAHWIDTCFGEEMTRQLEDAPISCAGGGRGVGVLGGLSTAGVGLCAAPCIADAPGSLRFLASSQRPP